MDKRDEHSIAESGQISQHTEYIQESTMVPESESYIPETETVDINTGGGLPGGSAAGVRSATAKKSFVKENMPFLVIGTIAVILGGAFVFRPSQPNVNAPIVKKAPVAERQISPPQLPPVVEMATKPEDPKVVPVVDSKPPQATPLVGVGAPLVTAGPTVAVPTPMPAIQQAPIVVPTKPSPVVVTTATPGVVTTVTQVPAANGPVVLTTRSIESKSFSSEQTLRESLASTEKKLEAVTAELASKQACDPSVSAPTRLTTVKRHIKAKKVISKAKKSPPLEDADGFNVKAIKDGLAWIETDGGKIVTVRMGDSIKGLGAVTKIDDRAMRVNAGGKKIEQK